MPDYYASVGRSLLSNGYTIVPIRPGEKRPAIASWQNAKLGPESLAQYAEFGVGIICGQGAYPICGVDIDISHAIGAELVTWCEKWLPGVAPKRVGAAPRIMMVYRAEHAGWTKGSSTSFFDPADPVKPNGKKNEQRVEVLGLGQQFVAYHVHPDTGQPYEWVDWLGGLEHCKASELPILSEMHVAELMAEVDRLVRQAGLEVLQAGEATRSIGEAGALDAIVPAVDLTLEQVIAVLKDYPNQEHDDYDTWLRVGMALWHQFSGSDVGLDLFNRWSSVSLKHDAQMLRQKWPSFEPSPGRQPTTFRWVMKVANEAKRDREANEVRDSLTVIKMRIATATSQQTLTGPVAKELQRLMPEDIGARTEAIKAFGLRFKELAGVLLPLSEVKKLLLPRVSKAPTVRARRPLTEFGNADRMLERFGSGMMFVPELETWYLWTGIFWRRASDTELQHFAKVTVRSLLEEIDEHDDNQAEFFDWCKTSQQATMVRNMVKLASSDPRVMVPAAELDKHTYLVAARNGVVDLRTGSLLPAAPEYRITQCLGCEYKPLAGCPLFKQTVTDVFFGQVEMMQFFHRLIGYSLLGDPVEDVVVIPFGNGSNGKSTVLNAVRQAFGSYARAAAAETFVSSGGYGGNAGGPREDVLRLKGSRFAYVAEPDENGELRESAIKSMSGGDAIPARGINAKHSIEVEATWVAWMPTNHKPIVRGNDNGIWRRLVLLPFTRNFETDTAAPKDEHRAEKLRSEAEGILNWCVQGAVRYSQIGLSMPKAVIDARNEYRAQMDVLSEWLDECCDVEQGVRTRTADLWSSWENWAKRNGAINHVRSSIALGKKLEQRFPSYKDGFGNRFRQGLRVKLILAPFNEANVLQK